MRISFVKISLVLFLLIFLYGASYIIRTIWFRPDNIHYFFLRFPYSYAQVFPEEASVVEIPQADLLTPYQSYLNYAPYPSNSPRKFWQNVEKTLKGYSSKQLTKDELYHQRNLLWVSQYLQDTSIIRSENPIFLPLAGLETDLIYLLDVIQNVRDKGEAESYLARLKRFGSKVDFHLGNTPLPFSDSLSQSLYLDHLNHLISLPNEQQPIYRSFARKAISADPTLLNESEAARLLGEVSRTINPTFKESLQKIVNNVNKLTPTSPFPERSLDKSEYKKYLAFYTTLNLNPDSLHESGRLVLDSLPHQDSLVQRKLVNNRRESEIFLDSLNRMSQYLRQVSSGLFELPIRAPLAFRIANSQVKGLPLWAEYQFLLNTKMGSGIALFPKDSAPVDYWLPYLSYVGIPGIHGMKAVNWNNASPPYIHREFLSFPAFEQGWGLYVAATLQEELGLFSQNPLYFQGYNDLMRLSLLRCVLDTGIHGKYWSFLQAKAFMQENCSLTEDEIISQLLYIFHRPGYFSAPWVGYQSFISLRNQTRARLKEEFYLQDFHTQIMETGPGTFFALEERLK